MNDLSVLPIAIRTYVRRFIARERRVAAMRAVGWSAAFLLAWILVSCAADRSGHFLSTTRAAMLCGGAALSLVVLGRLLRAARSLTDWVSIAERIEGQNLGLGERLVTVMSRLLGRPEHRGSDEILEQLVYEIDREVAGRRAARLMPLRAAVVPWMVMALLALIGVGLCRLPDLAFGRLLARQLLPLRDLPPVTTTHLAVSPGDRDVVQASPLAIQVSADHLGGAQVWLNISDDARSWSRTVMDGQGDGRFSLTLGSVERDVRYFISGGDAESPTYSVRVLRRPTVTEFRIRYTFPAYTGRPPLTVTNADGTIEAPTGSEALVTITATEPLQSALFSVGPEKYLMTRAGDSSQSNVRQCRLPVRRDARYDLDLISTRDVAGTGPAGPGSMTIRALPDLPPRVRLAEAGETLRLNPRDILPLDYEVRDDYGIDTVSIRTSVGSAAAVETLVDISADGGPQGPFASPGPAVAGPPQRRDGVYPLDLATLPLAIGDVVTVAVTVRDSAGQPTYSEPVHVLVSPRSINLDAHERMADLDAASQLTDSLVDDLTGGEAALAELVDKVRQRDSANDRDSGPVAAAAGRLNRRLSAVAETAAMIRRSLLRAAARSDSSEFSTALQQWVDAAQIVASVAETTFRSGIVTNLSEPPPADKPTARDAARDALAQTIHQLLDPARMLRTELKNAAQGERASAVRADRENLAAAEKRPAATGPKVAERLRETLNRTREEIAVGAAGIGLDPKSGNLDDRLREKVDAEAALVRAKRPIDFAAAAREWSQRMQNDPHQPGLIDERLATAAQAEAVDPRGDLRRARDLHLGGRAAAAIAASVNGSPTARISPATLNEFAAAVAALQREHDLHRRPSDVRRAEEVAVISAAATNARELMSHWADDPIALGASRDPAATSLPSPASIAGGISAPATRSNERQRAETLAMAAAAETAARNYAKARDLDRALASRLASGSGAPAGDANVRPAPAPATRDASPVVPAQVGAAVASAEALDRVGSQQQTLAEETQAARAKLTPARTAPSTEPAGDAIALSLAARQQEVANRIAGVAAASEPTSNAGALSAATADDPNWRSRATTVILATQQRLSEMPQQLTDALEAATARRSAAALADTARRNAEAAPPDRKPSADRAAAQTARDARDAAARSDSALTPVSASVAETAGISLEPFSPETAAARDIITVQLGPALKALGDAVTSKEGAGDPARVERAAADARQAVDTAQRELVRAQELFVARDPLMAAKQFARAAADALTRKPPDYTAAERHQRDTATALSRAWDRSIHDAAARRLALVPSLRPLFSAAAPASPAAVATGGKPAADAALPAGRDWRRLRPRESDDIGAAAREADPAGYESSLKLYFEALGKAREK